MDTPSNAPWFFEIIESAACASLREAPGEWASEATPSPRDGAGPWIVACIGFSGDARGSLALAATPAVVPSLCAYVDGASPTGFACDALGELANQTLGRVKVLLLSQGLVVMPAIPTSLLGKEIELSQPVGTHWEWRSFRCAGGVLHVRVDLDLTDCPLPRAVDASEEPIGEGQALLF